MSDPATTTSLGYTRPPIDACEEAAQRINVVIRMLHDHDCKADDDTEDSTGGYELSIMRDALKAIRDLLQNAADAEKAAR